ncbi:MAG: SdrD B-like domain-containing protein [Caldilinea sp.]|jgi:hypothetical protein
MSVQNESLELKKSELDLKSSERKLAAPELEYRAAGQDSLSMFFAAIGGAVLGMLATMLVLAIINGGTLNFTRPERMAVMEANLARLSENIGAVSQNVDVVAGQVVEVRDQLAGARSQVDRTLVELDEQGVAVQSLQGAVDLLAVTGARFDTFVAALDQALLSMQEMEATVAEPTAAVKSAPAAVEPDAVALFFYVDSNQNGAMDAGEAGVAGVTLRVFDDAGGQVGEFVSAESGVTVGALAPGSYTFAVVDAGPYSVAGDPLAVTVDGAAAEGQRLYVPLAD